MRENEVLPENSHSGRTVSRPDVRPVVTRWTYALELGRTINVKQGNPIFTYRPIAPIFLTLRYFSGIRTNRRFSTDLENPSFWSIRRRLLIQVSFNSHNAHCYFSYALHIYFIYCETCIFYNSLLCT